MKANKTLAAIYVFLLLAVVNISGCSAVNYIVTPYEDITLTGTSDLNPDINGRPSPVQIRILHLTSRVTFDNLDFDEAFYNASTILSDELVYEQLLTLQPKQEYKSKVEIHPGVMFTAVIVAYRDIDNADWRIVKPLSDSGYYNHKYLIGSDKAVFLSRSRKPILTSDNIQKTRSTADEAVSLKETTDNVINTF